METIRGQKKHRRRQKIGFTLLELILAMGAAASIAVLDSTSDNLDLQQENARQLGQEIAQYNSAVSQYIAQHSQDPETSLGIDATHPIVHSGSDWLKSLSQCTGGLSSDSLLPCHSLASNQTQYFRSVPTTTIRLTAVGELEARTTWTPAINSHNEVSTIAMGIASLVASGAYLTESHAQPSAQQLPTVYCPDLSSFSASLAERCQGDANHIVSTSTTSASVQPWLRTDHQNTMSHVMEFGANVSSQSDIDLVDDGSSEGGWTGSGMRQLVNVARIYHQAGPGASSIILGSKDGQAIYSDSFLTAHSLFSDAAIVDGDLAAMQELTVKANALIAGDLDIGDTLNVTGDIVSNSDIQVRNDITTSNGTLRALSGTLQASQVHSTGDHQADRSMYAKRFYDGQNTSRYADPASRSLLNSVTASRDIRAPIFYDQNNSGYYLNPSSRSNINSMTVNGDARATVFYDQNNTSYRADFEGYSRLNRLDTDTVSSRGRIRTDEYLDLNRTVSLNGWCSPSGLVGRTGDGLVASCVSNRWTSGGGELFKTLNTTKLSRNHTYTNTTGGPMQLTFKVPVKSYGTITIDVNGREVTRNYIPDVDGGDIKRNIWWSPSVIIPAGATYRIEATQVNGDYTTTRAY